MVVTLLCGNGLLSVLSGGTLKQKPEFAMIVGIPYM
jgi:hypothetical protein